MSGNGLVGRARELGVLDAFVDELPKEGGALVLRGDPGIGKSALLSRAAHRAERSGCTVVSVSGVEAETHLPFAGLHQLTRTLLDRVPRLPPAQSEALRAAFGMSEAYAADEAPAFFMIALATLSLLGEAAGETPVLLVVDDTQWLDTPTADVLAFLARRLGAEPLGLLAGVRTGHTTPLDALALPELRLGPLPQPDAAGLLDAVEPRLDPAVRRRVLDAASGNPLALIELPTALRARVTTDILTSPAVPLTARLEQAFASRLPALPAGTRSVLLVAASDDEGTLSEVFAAASRLSGSALSPAVLDPAVRHGLVTADERHIRFCHPLVRSAVLQAAPLAERLAAHRALAAVLDADSDRRTWHRAAASGRRDEAVARELDRTAARAETRGAPAVALTAVERAVTLGEGGPATAHRLLKAAELSLELGMTRRAATLLQDAAPLELGVLERARTVLLREGLEEDVSRNVPRLRLLIATAEAVARERDHGLALRILRAAARRCWWSDPGRELRERLVAAAERLPVPDLHPELVYVLAGAAPLERGDTVIERLERLQCDGGYDAAAAATLGTAATMAGAYDLAPAFLRHAAAGLRAQGRLGLLSQVLVSLSFTAAHVVDWESGLPSVAEAMRLAEENALPRWLTGARIARAQFAAVLGDLETARSAINDAERHGLSVANPSNLAFVQITRGLIGLAAGRQEEAFGCVWRVFDPADPAHHPYLRTIAIPVLAEAAVTEEHRASARAALRRLDRSAAATHAGLIRAGLAYAHALLADDEDAEARFRTALRLDLSKDPFTRARLLLAHGTWLRRRRRVMESRTPLRIARESFAALGAEPWHERARQELRSAGESGTQRTAARWDLLTPQELQIAQLAAEGLSNREIGQQLYLSPRTIGAHLYRIYPKLGITSRGQLRERLGPPASS
ncbi:ATP-binding protein [Streptomyces sp. NPDC085946]|uniref:ATP-binding protein n=1 Tax=Streptomyces sp. NPDC085946 TaxID=3365744 RepID=UPI0037D24527